MFVLVFHVSCIKLVNLVCFSQNFFLKIKFNQKKVNVFVFKFHPFLFYQKSELFKMFIKSALYVTALKH